MHLQRPNLRLRIDESTFERSIWKFYA
jgi:hypothetical protein